MESGWSTAETVEVTGPSASSRTTPAAVAASTVAAPATSAAAVAATAVAVAETAVAVAATAVAVAAAPNDRQVLFLALAGPYREGGGALEPPQSPEVLHQPARVGL